MIIVASSHLMELQRCIAVLPEVYKLFCVLWKDWNSAQLPLHLPRKQQCCLLLVERNNFKLGTYGERLFTKAYSDGTGRARFKIRENGFRLDSRRKFFL